MAARALDPIDSVDAGGVELDVVQVLARVPRERGIGVEVHDPIIELEVGKPDVDRQRLCEALAVPFEVGAKCDADAVPLTDRDRAGVILRGDDNPVVEERLVNPYDLLEEIVIVETDGNRFDFHGECAMPKKIEMTLKHSVNGKEIVLATWTASGGFDATDDLGHLLHQFFLETEFLEPDDARLDDDDLETWDPTMLYQLACRPAIA